MFTSATVAAVAAAASPTNAVNVTVDEASAGSDLEFNDDLSASGDPVLTLQQLKGSDEQFQRTPRAPNSINAFVEEQREKARHCVVSSP